MPNWAMHTLPVDAWEGTVNGVQNIWTPLAKKRLPGSAIKYRKTEQELKQATEELAYECAVRIQKIKNLPGPPKVRIIGSFHDTTTVSQGIKLPDECHTTARVEFCYSQSFSVHTYVDLDPDRPIEDMRVLRRTVWVAGKFDQALADRI